MKYLFLFFPFLTIAQTLSSSLNKTKIDLGEPIILTIKVQNLQYKEVVSAPKNALLPFHFEENKDKIQIDGNQYTRSIEFTIFDEGKYSIPPLEFKIGDSIHKTIPYEIEVTNPIQKDEEISDIMENKEVELDLVDYWELYQNYIFAILGIFIIVLGILFFKKQRKTPIQREVDSTNKALKELEKLKTKKYIETEEYRLFYIEFIEIIRNFLEFQYQIPANILLTDDLIEAIKQNPYIPANYQKVLEEIFTRGDLVKFAKTIPDKTLMETDFSSIKEWIKSH